MVRKAYTPEQIINKLREAEIHINQGIPIAEASRKIGITEQTYYRWRREYGGLRIEQARKTQRRMPYAKDEEMRLVERIIALATQYGRYGYRRITALLNQEGWRVNHKRIERIWRREGLKGRERTALETIYQPLFL